MKDMIDVQQPQDVCKVITRNVQGSGQWQCVSLLVVSTVLAVYYL